MNEHEHAELRSLGERVRQLREHERFSVAELATRTGVKMQRIRELEAGRFDPTLDLLIALARGLEIRLSGLVPQD
jgi:transcriptional regulator with XRE-family HTH domain